MAVTDQIRDTAKLNKLVKIQLECALAEIKKQGVTPLVVETYRTLDRQKWLYGQGRSKRQCRAVGVPESYARVGGKLTQTLYSIHLIGCAVDVVPVREGKAIWNSKDRDTIIIINTMAKHGFECGANWKTFKDSPHYQVKGIAQQSVTYSTINTNAYVTKLVQKNLNEKLGLDLKVDGLWGKKTTQAVNQYRRKLGYKESGTVGTKVLKKLIS